MGLSRHSKRSTRITGRPVPALELLEQRWLLAAEQGDIVSIRWGYQHREAIAGEWVVKFDSGRGKLNRQVSAAARRLSAVRPDLRVVTNGNMRNTFLVNTPTTLSTRRLMRALKTLPGFKYAEPNLVIRTSAITPNDPNLSQAWGLVNTGQAGGTADADIDAPEAWEVTTGSANVIVGVIDSGIDFSHPDLAANIWTNPREIPNDGLDNDGNSYVDDVRGWDVYNWDADASDDNGHGTAISGTIAAVGNNALGSAGVAFNTKILPVKAVNASGTSTTFYVGYAVGYLVTLKQAGANIRVINMSVGTYLYDSQPEQDAIWEAQQAGMLVVAAAGNDHQSIEPPVDYWPAGSTKDNVISVAATNRNDQLSSFSNYGATTVDLAAPGEDIYTTAMGGGYTLTSGTSLSAPMVTGVAALAWAANPNLTYTQVRNAILNGVDPLSGLAGKTVTGGRLNALGTLNQVALYVTGSSPSVNQVVLTAPTDFSLDFSATVDVSSVQAGDLKVNGVGASSVSFVDTDTLRFHYNVSPVGVQGVQTMSIATGAVTAQSGSKPLPAWTRTFRYDSPQLQVISASPANGSIAAVGLTTIRLDFNEAFDPATLQASDLTVSRGAVTGVSSVDADTAVFSVSGLNSEGNLTYSLANGALTDAVGNPGGAFSASVMLDFDTAPILTPFVAVAPEASLVFTNSISGTIDSGDSDSFTVNLRAGQSWSVLVDPSAMLGATLQIKSPSGAVLGSAQSSSAGMDALLQTVPISTSGVYTISVGAAVGTGGYALRLTLNGALEGEEQNGGTNGTVATAQSIDSAFSTVAGGARAAVTGSISSGSDVDFYSLTLAAGDHLTLGIMPTSGNGPVVSLLDSTGINVATGVSSSGSFSNVLSDVAISTAGTYFVKVSASAASTYTLVAALNLLVEQAPNEPRSAAQAIVPGKLMGGISANAVAFTGFSDDFERASLGPNYTTYWSTASTGQRVRIDSYAEAGGRRALFMDADSKIYTMNSNEAEFTVEGTQNPTLTFDYFAFALLSGNSHAFPSQSFTGHKAGDGITISPDGVNWYVAWSPPSKVPSQWQSFTVNLASAAAQYGITLTTNTRVRLQQADYIPAPYGGRAYDSLVVSYLGPDVDYYKVPLPAGEAYSFETSTPAVVPANVSVVLDPVVEIYDSAGNLVGSDDNGAVDGRNARFSFTLATAGEYIVAVRAKGGASSGAYLLDVGVARPVPPIPGVPVLLVSSDTGISNSDKLTRLNNSSAVSTLQFTVAYTTPGQTVSLYCDGALIGSALATDTTTTITTNGATAISDGDHIITARQTPPGQPESADSVGLRISVDATVPSAPVSAPDLLTDHGISSTDNLTNDATSDFAVAGAPYFRFYRDQTLISGGYESGTTYTTPCQSDGTNSFSYSTVDAAGNESSRSPSLAVTLDTVAPPVPPPLDMWNSDDSGPSNTDNITNRYQPHFDVGVSGRYDIMNLVFGYEVGLTGSVWQPATQWKTNNSYSLSVAVSDDAGNQSVSTPLSVKIKVTDPAVPGTPDLLSISDTGISSSDNLTNSSIWSVSVNSPEAGATHFLLNGHDITRLVDGAGAHTYSLDLNAILPGYQSPVTLPAGQNGKSVATADFNKDAKLDIALIDADGNIAIHYGKGDGTFGSATILSMLGVPDAGPASFVVAGDLGKDGYPDLIAPVAGRPWYVRFINNGDGTFSSRSFYASDVFTAVDLRPVGYADANLIIGTTGAFVQRTFIDHQPYGVTYSNSDTPVAVSGLGLGSLLSASGSVKVRLGTGDWEGVVGLPIGKAYSQADFDGDGNRDFVIVGTETDGTQAIARFTKSNNAGTFIGVLRDIALPDDPRAVTVADFNTDGKQDFAVACGANNGQVLIYLGHGDLTFDAPMIVDLGAKARQISSADFNQDGKPDLLTLNDNGTVSVILSGTATLSGSYTLSAFHEDLGGNRSSSSVAINVVIDSTVPTVQRATPNPEWAPHDVRFTFSEPIAAAPPASAFAITSVAGGAAFNPDVVLFDSATRTARLRFNALPPDGDYRVTLAANSVADQAGNLLSAPFSISFYSFKADANGDRLVDVSDLALLAAHYGTVSNKWSAGDFNEDGVVDVSDLALLAANYGKTLPLPGAVPASTPFSSGPLLQVLEEER